MAGAKSVTLAPRVDAARQKPGSEPLGEPISGNMDRFPIWVHITDAAALGRTFRSLAKELSRMGLECDSDLQTEPHKDLRLVNFFEVYYQPEGAREPEGLGMVSLYHDEEGRALIKMSHYSQGAADIFRKALAGAIEREIGALASSGPLELEVVIRQQQDFCLSEAPSQAPSKSA